LSKTVEAKIEDITKDQRERIVVEKIKYDAIVENLVSIKRRILFE